MNSITIINDKQKLMIQGKEEFIKVLDLKSISK